MDLAEEKQHPADDGAWYDSESKGIIINETGVDNADIVKALQSQNPEMAALMRWSQTVQTESRRGGGIFDRDTYTSPSNIFDEFRVASHAAEYDDVVAGVVSATESLAFNKMSLECEDEDEQNIWNQVAADMDFDARLREMWRELFTVSQFYAAILWGTKDYKVKGTTPNGTRRKKEFKNLTVPVGLTLLDPLKVIPVGNLMFNRERLVYIASETEGVQFDKVLAGENTSDLIVNSLIEKKYNPKEEEKRVLQDIVGPKVDLNQLFYLKEENVFRHTETRPQYERFAPVRLKSVFELLDMKHQLRQMDRAFLLAGTNFIVLVTKGTDEKPATGREISQLATQVKMSARIPIIIGDHRINVEIITPKLDVTLEPNKHNLIDSRITSRLYQILASGNYSSGMKGDDSIKISRIIARGMESRRHMMKRALEIKVWKAAFDKNPSLKSNYPKLRFHPKRITLDFDNNVATYLQDLRDRGDISRQTLLDEVDISQEQEALKRKREEENGYDDVFTPPFVPFSGEAANPVQRKSGSGGKAGEKMQPKAAGRRQGGNKAGGGVNPDSRTPNKEPIKPVKKAAPAKKAT
jgi:hypothetical protein